MAWADLTQSCDTCRTIDRQCEGEDNGNGFSGTCKCCVETDSPCDWSLAMLNHFRPHNVTLDYHMQLMFQERLFTARREQSGNHALQDYQMQLILLEQQKKKRLLMARQQPNSTGLTPSHSQPFLSGSPYSQPPSNALQYHQMQDSFLRGRDERRLLEARQAPTDGAQTLRAGSNQPAQDNQATLPVPRSGE